MTSNLFHPSLLLLFLDPGSGMAKNQDPGSGINIPDPQHWSPVKPFEFETKVSLHLKMLAREILQVRVNTRCLVKPFEFETKVSLHLKMQAREMFTGQNAYKVSSFKK